MRENKSIAERVTHIGAGIIIVYIVQYILLHIIELVGIATLIVISERCRVVQLPSTAQITHKAYTATTALTPIHIATIVSIVEEALIHTVVICTYRVAELTISAAAIVRCLGTGRHTRAILYGGSYTLIVHRRESIYIHLATHRISAIERTLWATQQLHASNVEHIEVVVVLVKEGHAIYGKADDRLVDTCTKTTHIDRRGHLRAVVGLIEVRHDR